jgi:hypothetical protein
MPCCNKRRKIIEARRRVLQEQSLQKYRMMRDKNPTSLNDKLLLDYHKKTHMLYAGAIARRPVNKPFVNSMVNLHDKFAEELLNRGMKHNTPLKKV